MARKGWVAEGKSKCGWVGVETHAALRSSLNPACEHRTASLACAVTTTIGSWRTIHSLGRSLLWLFYILPHSHVVHRVDWSRGTSLCLDAVHIIMAQLLAPYNNSMRLGQGFNSYTQQICLDRAVLQDSKANKERLARLANDRAVEAPKATTPAAAPSTGSTSSDLSLQDLGASVGDSEDAPDYVEEQRKAVMAAKNGRDPINRPPWVKPQIVTYSSRFVDKLSDVTGQSRGASLSQ
jgi:hypothetical protein